MRPRPAGADNFLRWRRSIDEHLELRRITWDEFGMFTWLCTKANARTGSVRTSWPTLSEQTGLTPNHVEKLCRALKRKRYVWYPVHRGARGRLVDVAIHKYPLAHGSYTDLSPRFAAEVPAEVLADVAGSARAGARGRVDVLADVPAELADETVEGIAGFTPRKTETENRERHRRRRACPARAPRARRARGAVFSAPRRSRHPRGHSRPPRHPAVVATVGGWAPESNRAGDRPARAQRSPPMNLDSVGADQATGRPARRDKPTGAAGRAAGDPLCPRGMTGGSKWCRGGPESVMEARRGRPSTRDGRMDHVIPAGPRPCAHTQHPTRCPHQEMRP